LIQHQIIEIISKISLVNHSHGFAARQVGKALEFSRKLEFRRCFRRREARRKLFLGL